MLKQLLIIFSITFSLNTFAEKEKTSDRPPAPSLEEQKQEREKRLAKRAKKAKALADLVSSKEQIKITTIPLKKQIDHFLYKFLERGFKAAEAGKADIVIIDMSTPGGAVDQTKKILELIRKYEGLVYVLINDEATSAGAIISFGCDGIYMVPSSTIGSAAPIIMTGQGVANLPPDVQEKMLSYVRATARAQAEENGYDPLLAEAMIDNDIVVYRGKKIISDKDKLLNLTAEQATERYEGEALLADAKVEDFDGLLAELGIDKNKAIIHEVKPNSSEDFAEKLVPLLPIIWLASLMLIYSEIQSPGFGGRGILGISGIVFSLFIQNYAGMANFWEMLIIILGIVLIAFEFFVIPGFGVTGILGICMVLGGLFMSFLQELDFKELPDYDFRFAHYLDIAIHNTMIVGGGFIICFILFLTLLPKLPFYNKLILASDQGAISEDSLLDAEGLEILNKNEKYLGKTGICKSDLRPAGIITIDEQRLDVMTAGEKILAGTEVKVIAVEGTSITVEATGAPQPLKA